MADNYYDDEQGEQESGGGKDKGPSPSSTLLPKSVLMGKNFSVGDEVVLKITAIHGDEVAVEYADGESKPEPTEDPSEEQPEPGEEGQGEEVTAGGGSEDMY